MMDVSIDCTLRQECDDSTTLVITKEYHGLPNEMAEMICTVGKGLIALLRHTKGDYADIPTDEYSIKFVRVADNRYTMNFKTHKRPFAMPATLPADEVRDVIAGRAFFAAIRDKKRAAVAAAVAAALAARTPAPPADRPGDCDDPC